ncbi:Lipase 1 [Candida maltosa Xu316]|uniref:Lipase 1 n=1 Tax=Candida maltosa (strain Xu316) TaxID=1245528 RepID=M3HQ51_CANMX|nr:Lipase 1 [Candida maltosa Xu316]
MKFLIFLLLSIISPILASPIAPTPPSEDPFYSPPAGYENAKNGEILKLRKTPHQLSSLVFPAEIKNSWQLLVKSEDQFGNDTAIVTTIIEPYNADPSKLLSYQTFEDSASVDCATSYGLQYGAPLGTIAIRGEMTFIVDALKNGYYVNVPDHNGPKATWTVGKQSGHATLDAIQAALKSGNETGIDEKAEVALWGFSGGSLASAWAASLQEEYAPALDGQLIGAALGGFFTNLTALLEITDGALFAGFIPNLLNGLGNGYPEFRERLDDRIGANASAVLHDDLDYCAAAAIASFYYDEFFTGPKRLFADGFGVLDDPYVSEVLHNNSIVTWGKESVPKIPIFVYHGTLDSVCPIKDVRVVYQNWCDWGIESFEFAEALASGHNTETIIGAPAALTWLEARFNGVEPVKGCQHTTRLINALYPNVSSATYDYYMGLYDVLVGDEIGPDVNSDNSSMNANENEVIRNIHKLPNELIDLIFSYIPACGLNTFLSYPPLVHHVAKFITKQVEITGPTIPDHKETHIIAHCRETEHTIPSFVNVEDLIEFCKKYHVLPKEVWMYVDEIQQNDVSFLKLCNSICLWGSIDGEEEYQVRREMFEELNIHEFNFRFPENSFNSEFVGTFPKKLRCLGIETGKTLGYQPVFKQFQFLETLHLQSANMDLFRCLPASVSRLTIQSFHVDRDYNVGDSVLWNLKSFNVPLVSYDENFTLESVFRQMPNLQEFSTTAASISDDNDAYLPTSLKSLSLSYVTTFGDLTRLENLRELILVECEFPVEAFKDSSNFPHLQVFEFYTYKNSDVVIDHMTFPDSLRMMTLTAPLSIKKWTLPKRLSFLEVNNFDFGKDFKLDLPSSLDILEIARTSLESLDGVIFPIGLTILRIVGNACLTSMRGTNLDQLERLSLLLIIQNGFERMDMDEPINSPKCVVTFL